MAVVAIALLATSLAQPHSHSKSHSSKGTAKTDTFGDPYITEAQGRSVQLRTRASIVFQELGGKAVSGTSGTGPTKCYDYPVRGTGNPDDATDDNTVWWQFCMKNGRLVAVQRGTMNQLPTY